VETMWLLKVKSPSQKNSFGFNFVAICFPAHTKDFTNNLSILRVHQTLSETLSVAACDKK